MLNFIRREPAAVVGLVVAGLALVVAFGIPISTDQKAAIVGVVTAILSILGAGVTRSQVTPTAKLRNRQRGHVDLSVVLLVGIVVVIVLALLGYFR